MLKYFSMFSGIGGFEKGIEQSNLQAQCVGYSEIDKYAIDIYEGHFNHRNYGDATRIIPEQLPDFDLLVGGFPCQAFSIAGKRQGFEDTRGTLFFEVARILRVKKSKYVILENVKGLLSHDNNRTIITIFGVLTELGYSVSWQILNSKHFGVPQNRERIFIFGTRNGSGEQIFPIGISKNEDNELQGQQIATNTITAKYANASNGSYVVEREQQNGLKQIGVVGKDSEATRIYSDSGIARTIKNGGGMGAKTGLYAISYTRDSKVTSHHEIDEDGLNIRRLTPIEVERLQGFTDNWSKFGKSGNKISDSQRYKCVGNSVTVNVIEAIMNKLNEVIK